MAEELDADDARLAEELGADGDRLDEELDRPRADRVGPRAISCPPGRRCWYSNYCPRPPASWAGALVFGLEFKLVLGAAVTGSAPRFAGFPGF